MTSLVLLLIGRLIQHLELKQITTQQRPTAKCWVISHQSLWLLVVAQRYFAPYRLSTLHPSISQLRAHNGDKLHLTATQLNNLNSASSTVGGKILAGPIDLTDTLANLAALSAATLASASSYTLTDTPGLSGQVASTLTNISVSNGDIVRGAVNKADYLYSLRDTAANLSAQDVSTVAVIGDASGITVSDTPSMGELDNILWQVELIPSQAAI